MAENTILSEAGAESRFADFFSSMDAAPERKVFRTYAEYANFARSSPEFAQNKWVQFLEEIRRDQEQGLESKEESIYGDLTDDDFFGKLLYNEPTRPDHQESVREMRWEPLKSHIGSSPYYIEQAAAGDVPPGISQDLIAGVGKVKGKDWSFSGLGGKGWEAIKGIHQLVKDPDKAVPALASTGLSAANRLLAERDLVPNPWSTPPRLMQAGRLHTRSLGLEREARIKDRIKRGMTPEEAKAKESPLMSPETQNELVWFLRKILAGGRIGGQGYADPRQVGKDLVNIAGEREKEKASGRLRMAEVGETGVEETLRSASPTGYREDPDQMIADFAASLSPARVTSTFLKAGKKLKERPAVQQFRDWRKRGKATRKATGGGRYGGLMDEASTFAQPLKKEFFQKEKRLRFKPIEDPPELLLRHDPFMKEQLDQLRSDRRNRGEDDQLRFTDVFEIARDHSKANNLTDMISAGLANVVNVANAKLANNFNTTLQILTDADVTISTKGLAANVEALLGKWVRVERKEPEIKDSKIVSPSGGRLETTLQDPAPGEIAFRKSDPDISTPESFESLVAPIAKDLLNTNDAPDFSAGTLWGYRRDIDAALDDLPSAYGASSGTTKRLLLDLRKLVTQRLNQIQDIETGMSDYARNRTLLDNANSVFGVRPGMIQGKDAGLRAAQASNAPANYAEVGPVTDPKGAWMTDKDKATIASAIGPMGAKEGLGPDPFRTLEELVEYAGTGDMLLPLIMGWKTSDWFASNLIAKQQTAQAVRGAATKTVTAARDVLTSTAPLAVTGGAGFLAGGGDPIALGLAALGGLVFVPAALLFSPKGLSKIKTFIPKIAPGQKKKGIERAAWEDEHGESLRFAENLKKEIDATLSPKKQRELHIEVSLHGMSIAALVQRSLEPSMEDIEETFRPTAEESTMPGLMEVLGGMTNPRETIEKDIKQKGTPAVSTRGQQ